MILMIGNSIGFGEEIKKYVKNMSFTNGYLKPCFLLDFLLTYTKQEYHDGPTSLT